MLHWRIPLGILLVAVLLAACWLDHAAPIPGAVLFPVALLCAVAATREVIHLAAAGGMKPAPWALYTGNLLILAGCWLPVTCPHFSDASTTQGTEAAWSLAAVIGSLTLLALAVGVLLVFIAEMARYREPGRSTINVATGVFALVYVGLLLSFVVGLRTFWGIGALASLVIVVKMGDIGAYTVGRLIGRHKMAPVLSPGKTIEGAFGALLFASVASWATFRWLVPAIAGDAAVPTPGWGWLPFGLLIAMTGITGDLAESLIKRDVGRKDSSDSIPGFGGVLDILDSVLLSAPVAYGCWWVFELLGT